MSTVALHLYVESQDVSTAWGMQSMCCDSYVGSRWEMALPGSSLHKDCNCVSSVFSGTRDTNRNK